MLESSVCQLRKGSRHYPSMQDPVLWQLGEGEGEGRGEGEEGERERQLIL